MLPLNTIVKFGRYKGQSLENLINDRSYANWVLENLSKSSHVSKEMIETIKHLSDDLPDEPITGCNLTSRTKSLLANRQYNKIIEHNIPNIDLKFDETYDIISEEFCNFIRGLHSIQPSGSGCFIDYLLRRVWSEKIGINFDDSRANHTISCIDDQDDQPHIEYGDYKVNFPKPYIDAYTKVKDIKNKSIDIISDIFIVSLGHSYFFHEYDEDIAVKQFKYIENKFIKTFENDISKIINLIPIKDKISINPNIGFCGISADADLIIDDNIIDFKVTKCHNYKYETFQLLGYSALSNVCGHFINKVHIFNLYLNVKKSINISNWTANQRNSYLEYIGCSLPQKHHLINFYNKNTLISSDLEENKASLINMTKNELILLCKERGIKYSQKNTKMKLVEQLGY